MAEIWVYAERFEYGKDAKHEAEHRAGVRLLRKALEERFGLAGEDEEVFSMEAGPRGKPYLKKYPEIEFNISHCNGLAVCAVGDCPLGVDVEKERPYREALVRRVLSESELHCLAAGEPEVFFRFWTLKESYVKAVGCGITIPLQEVSFVLGETPGLKNTPSPGKNNAADEVYGQIRCSRPGFQFWQRRFEAGFVLAVCAGTEEEVTLRWRLPADG